MQAYHQTAGEALRLLKIAIQEARALLPAQVLTHHWVTGHHSPAAWRSVEAWYRQSLAPDPQVLETLTELTLLSEARANLETVATFRTQRPLDLGLKKQRRTA